LTVMYFSTPTFILSTSFISICQAYVLLLNITLL
jgi:hypothetical protein